MAFPVDEALIEAAEAALGQRLPDPHRERLRRDNGGEVRVEGYPADDAWWQLHPVRDASDRRRLKRTMAHIVAETQEARQWRGFPRDAISVAENGTGDRVVLQDSQYGWWDHETGDVQRVQVDWSEDELSEAER